MHISDFKLIRVEGKGLTDRKKIAKVVESWTTGYWFMKKTHTRTRVVIQEFCSPWVFEDTKEYCPIRVYDLADCFERKGKVSEH